MKKYTYRNHTIENLPPYAAFMASYITFEQYIEHQAWALQKRKRFNISFVVIDGRHVGYSRITNKLYLITKKYKL